MGFFDDIRVILASSKGGKKLLFTLFVVSLVMDAYLVLSPILAGAGVLSIQQWSPTAHLIATSIEIPIAVATILFWFLMMKICLRAKSGFLRSMLWIFAFAIGTVFTAQAYYLLIYRRSIVSNPA